jgi:ribokinase
MMKRVLNFGSINVDHVYRVEHFVQPGETLACDGYQRFAGGKGLNQSIALAHAGACVHHAGKIGQADGWLKSLLEEHGVDTRWVEAVEGPSGHAVIQVNAAGENAIVIVGGANQLFSEADVQRIVAGYAPGDYLLVQNEVARVPHIIRTAKAQGLTVVLNPAPMGPGVPDYPLDLVDLLVVNESEALRLSGESEPERIGDVLGRRYPRAATVLTMGAQGATYFSANARFHQPAERVRAVDTTAAGDTFIGFFLAEWIQTGNPASALACACRAAAICVTRAGAAASIPWRKELAP